ncbi:MAG: hypothetical protein R6X35_02305 [Candidatus Krumholzibacteriia bacterium]
MPRRFLIMMFVLTCLAGALLLAGCGDGEAEQAEQAAPPSGQPAGTAAQPAVEHSNEHPAATAVATHDCDGGCGMTAVPEDQMTEIHGQWYCGGGAKRAQEDHAGHDHG